MAGARWFANWPAAGAEHRCRLLAEDVAALVLGVAFDGPADLFDGLTAATRIRAIQCGEPGPFAQVIAGLDAAAWDLCARRAGVALRDLLAPGAPAAVPAYASGIAVAAAPGMVAAAREAGFDAAKVKVGFDALTEPAALAALRRGAGPDLAIMADANQAWDERTAAGFLDAVRELDLAWLEEPVVATASGAVWRRLAARGTPIAGGENLGAAEAFAAAIDGRHLAVVQPDVAKWGGVTGCLRVARRARAAGLAYCPHFLGGGIGLAASAHLLAAAGGPGRLEVDVNPNGLRDAFGTAGERVRDGAWRIAVGPGIGVEALPEAIARHETCRVEVRA